MSTKWPSINKLRFRFGDYTFDTQQILLLREDGEAVRLPPKAYDALVVLAELKGATATKEQLRNTLWPDSYVEEASLTQTIFLLRKALGNAPDGGHYIETVPKRGYRLRVAVETLECPSASDIEGALHPEDGTVPTHVVLKDASLSPTRMGWRTSWMYAGIAAILPIPFLLAMLLRDHTVLKSPGIHVGDVIRLTSDGNYKEYLCPLLAAGNDLLFTETIDNHYQLAHLPAEGGEMDRTLVPNNHAVLTSVSTNQQQLLFSTLWEAERDNPLQVASMPGLNLPSSSVHTSSLINAHWAAFSPNGTRIAFTRGNNLYVAKADGTEQKLICTLTSIPWWPRWSPDGSRIRFSATGGGRNNTLLEVNAEGGTPTAVFAHRQWRGDECCGEWSHDGSLYTWVVSSGRGSSLWITGEKISSVQHGFSPQEIAPVGAIDFWRSPIFSADDRRIFAMGEQARGELVRYDGKTQHMEPELEGISSDTITFSRDGQWMAWTSYPDGSLWRARRDGSKRLKLTSGSALSRFPQWSPDGKSLLYIAAGTNEEWKIYEISAGGGQPHRLIEGEGNQGVATWSEDGSRVAFANLVLFGIQSSKPAPILIFNRRSGTLTPVPGSQGLWTVRWSPDGRYIAASTHDNRKLMLYDLASGTWSVLADTGVNDIVWSNDSRSLFYDSNVEPTLFRFTLSTHKLEPYANLKGVRRTGFFGFSLNITPENEPLILKQAGVNEVYSLRLSR